MLRLTITVQEIYSLYDRYNIGTLLINAMVFIFPPSYCWYVRHSNVVKPWGKLGIIAAWEHALFLTSEMTRDLRLQALAHY
ncbi:hypothetical protein BCR42DRAFT_9214 [Absidia repens]|uniref:Uncharacterized protein n=1 Tax=Absidia repens TaxID=90262 RepID=A0A1X2J0W2_9FUNG|nr:hypothetical protein BCR42DRAFT_9214 [Absidia repens]